MTDSQRQPVEVVALAIVVTVLAKATLVAGT
eukprot:SAG31_NODE_16808_length_695_cov_0.692953_1_plen_30_part_01